MIQSKEGEGTKIRLIIPMEKAKQLLGEGKKAIKEISIEVGYADQNYFSRAFKKYYQKSPLEFSSRRSK